MNRTRMEKATRYYLALLGKVFMRKFLAGTYYKWHD